MKTSTVDFSENKVVITGKKSPLVIRITLLIIMILCALLPLIAVAYRLKEGSGFHISLVPIFIVFGGFSYFLLRTVLWNTYGKEILFLEEDRITYVSDFKYFRSISITISNTENIQFVYVHKEKDTCLFRIDDKQSSIESVLPITRYDIQKLQQTIDKQYQIQS